MNKNEKEQYYGLLDACIQAQTIFYDKIFKTRKNRWLIWKPNPYLPVLKHKYFKYHMSLDELVRQNIIGYFKIYEERINEIIEKYNKKSE